MIVLQLYKNIKIFREKKGMSQEALAELVGYKGKSMIARIEAGQVDLAYSKICLFAKALGTSLPALMGLTNGRSVDTNHSLAERTSASADPDRQERIALLGARIRNLRKERGWTQEELAERVGYSSETKKSTINKIESGRSDLPFSRIYDFAKAFGVKSSELTDVLPSEMEPTGSASVKQKGSVAQRLKQIMEERGIKQVDVLELCRPYCEHYGLRLNRNDLSQYVSGKVTPKQDKLSILAMALNVNEVWLMGYDVPRSRDGLDNLSDDSLQSSYSFGSSLRSDEETLLTGYNKLNDTGKKEALQRIEEMAEIKKFTEEPASSAAMGA